MKLVSTFALAASLALGIAAAPAAAQGQQAQEAPARQYNLSAEGRKAIGPLQAAVTANDAAAYPTALAAAQAAAQTPDDRYVIGQLQLKRGLDTNDTALQLAALEAIAQSGGAKAEELPKIYRNLGALHSNAKNFDRAVAAYEQLAQVQPGSADPLLQIAELRAQQQRPADAVAYIERAIAAQKAASQAVPENWYRRALKFAYEGKLAPQSASLSRALLEAYPSPANWHDALLIFRGGARLDDAGEIDLLRLMRASKSLSDANDIAVFAEHLDRGSFYGEVQDVVREATAAGKARVELAEIAKRAASRSAEDKAALAGLEGKARADATGQTAMRIANGFFGHGDYGKAAELYRLAAEKGSVDTDLARLRLGIALALQGKGAEADAAFKSVSGTRADLAKLWSLWVSQRG